MAEPARAADGRVIVWSPRSAPQRALLACPIYEVFFGGARGGGKTDGMLGDWAQHSGQYGVHAIGLMVRRSRTELTETFERARQIFEPLGAKFTFVPMRCVMPNGARLVFAYLERDQDAESYQGHSYTRVYVEEAGNFPSAGPILKLMATLRSGAGVPCRIRLTGNPGGPGHQWLKARYIDPAPLGWKVLEDPVTGLQRVYIPSRVTDNAALANREQYIAQIRASGSPELVRAWLDGDWDVVAGAFFPEWSGARHVVKPIALPRHWSRFRSFDWGSARPFSVGWWAVSDGELPQFPRGALVRYREWYGCEPGEPNKGIRKTAEEIAAGILDREREDPIPAGRQKMGGVADPAIFTGDGGPSIAERMLRAGCLWTPADNKRVPQAGAMGGWDQVRQRLKGRLLGVDGDGAEEYGPAMVYVFSTCTDLIRTLPALQHDRLRPEDVDTEGEDHAADEFRYACMSRPLVRDDPDKGKAPSGGIRANTLRPQKARRGRV